MRCLALAAVALVALTACGSQGSTTTTVTTSGDSSSSGGGSGTASDPYTGYDEVFQLGNGTEVTCIEDNAGLSCDWGGR